MSLTIQEHKCVVCGKSGRIHPKEMLPKAGTVVECIHTDGTTHQWAEYYSMKEMIEKNKRRSSSIVMICPVCGKNGRVTDYHHDNTRPDKVSYLITHETLKGTWGNGKSTRKHRRCYITNKEHRDVVLKKLGRYIPDETSSEIKPSTQHVLDEWNKPKVRSLVGIVRRARVNCPRCHKRGRLDRAPKSSKTPDIFRFYIDHKKVKGVLPRCYMREGEERELAERLYHR